MSLKVRDGKRLAFRNIVCYKQINEYQLDDGTVKYITPYRRFHVSIGEKYKTKLNCKLFRVYEGFHTFKYEFDCIDNRKRLLYSVEYYDEKLDKTYPAKPLLVKCIIPFGSWYYEGTFNKKYECLVSDKIKIIEIIKEIT